MPHPLTKTLIMVGMMGAGKTAVGEALARHLGVPFADSDAQIEAAAAMTIPEIFARDGEAFFRLREAEVISRLLDARPFVLSTGGGAFLNPDVRAALPGRGLSVWLDVPLDELWARVRGKDTRPLLRVPDPYATLATLYEARVPVYRRADVAVRVEAGCGVEDAATRVLRALEGQGVLAAAAQGAGRG